MRQTTGTHLGLGEKSDKDLTGCFLVAARSANAKAGYSGGQM